MAKVIPTTFATIAPKIAARLVNILAIEANRILWIARDQVPHDVGEADILLRAGTAYSCQECNDGGSRRDTRLRRQLDVFIRVASGDDERATDHNWLFDDDGFFAYEHLVIDALQGFAPDDNGNWLVAEPMRLLTEGEARKEEGRSGTDGLLWGQGVLYFEVLYTLDLEPTDE